jgi:SNF2 family DNA or RNA helicase
MVVIDELSSFKNHQSQRWKALRKVRPQIKRMVGLTGTPASNGLLDLWAETFLIDGGVRLGRFIGRYREAYFKAAGMNPYTGVVFNYVPLPGAEEAIYSKIADISVSMKALDYLDMPEQVMVNHYVDMEPAERDLYDAMKKELLVELDGETIDAANAAVLSGKLLQMANGAIYNADRQMRVIHDQKLMMLSDLIEQANGQNVLVAYWYQHDHERIREYLTELGYHPRDLKSDQDIADWNAGKIQVGLISPASAGHGLNIQRGGHILIWFSLVWSLEMYQQTNARLWRQGQKEVVTIHHIVTRDTVDDDVLDALKHKDTTQQNLISAVKAHLTI